MYSVYCYLNSFNQVTISHMLWQLNCRECVTQFDLKDHHQVNFHESDFNQKLKQARGLIAVTKEEMTHVISWPGNILTVFISVLWYTAYNLTYYVIPWWRHQMETLSALLAICAGNSPVPGEFPAQRPVTRSFDVFFDLRLNKLLSKQWWGWPFETLSRPLWRHFNDS